jgi:hypothetical protein
MSASGIEFLDTRPAGDVAEAEYRRLLGYPPHHVPAVRARELSAWARRWYAEQGRPWVYLREVPLAIGGESDTIRLDGVAVTSTQLREHLLATGARRAVLVAVSAGRACEEHARKLWEEHKPDEYFFLEIFGSAVVEHLVASLSGRICDLAERDGFRAVPHYSPGYAGWDIADQHKLFDLIRRGQTRAWPEPLEVLPSGMLRPKKSLLAVFGLAAQTATPIRALQPVPCENCSFHPCQYRRVPYRHAAAWTTPAAAPAADALAVSLPDGGPLTLNARYSVNARALAKWARERVRLEPVDNDTIAARFRFDGTTCSNMGRPLAFDYDVRLGPAADGYPILAAGCAPVEGDDGHRHMCAYVNDAAGLMAAIAEEKPLLGRPLDDVLAWSRPVRPSGCFCDSESRNHKWGLALEAIHFALVHSGAPARPAGAPSSASP